MKKYWRKYTHLINGKLIYFISKILFTFRHRIIPSYDGIDEYSLEFSQKTRRYIYNLPKNKFSKILIDTSHSISELCELGKKFSTNKSQLNIDGHRSGYTSFYDILFNHLKNKKINLAEIGIEKNASTKMWRKYFNQSNIFLFEIDKNKISNAKKDKLHKSYYYEIDVRNRKNIYRAFKKTNKKYNIIIDDSTHLFNHQINIINSTCNFLKKNGILIIEDIYIKRKGYEEKNYYNALKNIKENFKKIYFVEFYNINNYTASWNNTKLLILIKK